MKPTRNKPPPKTPKKTPCKLKVGGKDTVKVYCRIRPMQLHDEFSCVSIVSPTVVQLDAPVTAVNYRPGSCKGLQYTFQHVFESTADQKQVFEQVAKPLVEELVNGQNGLLFTYGVTGCGKTFTMTGAPQDGGIMPRCLDVLFNTISDFQSHKYVFKPDKMNGFEVQSDVDAATDRQNEIYASIMSNKKPKTPFKKKGDGDFCHRAIESSRIRNIDEDNTYAVFITYVEIYNNSVFDLLEDVNDDAIKTKSLQNKMVREDATHNMYVHGVTEVEVKSTNEAFDLIYLGQKRKRMAHTTLNAESSRSHSVFTIRLVQAPLDGQGENIIQDKRAVCISQLSLVDLAGSERTNRTNNTGQRLREAGNINNSLMTLRNCLETLRENQVNGTNKIVSYRESRITHLFKSYFDGQGQIRMIVCVNPRCEDYDENIQVMKFAEMTQEVQVTRQTSTKANDLELMPGRRKANQLFKKAVQQLKENGNPEAENVKVDLDLIYNLGGPWPPVHMNGSDDERMINQLVAYLEFRINRRSVLNRDMQAKFDEFRAHLLNIERDNILLKQESESVKASLELERRKSASLETRLMQAQSGNTDAQKNIDILDMELKVLRQELDEKEMEVNQRVLEKERVKQKYSDKIVEEKEKIAREMQQKMKEQKADLKFKMRNKEEKLRRMKEILIDETLATPRSAISAKISKFEMGSTRTVNENIPETSRFPTPRPTRRGGTVVSNPRYRRSRSANGDTWTYHHPGATVPLGTVLQPMMKKCVSVTKLTDVKDVTAHSSKYCLVTQEADTDGELETRLYKGDVLPTSGGGAQIVFNDVETLKQSSPTGSPTLRKRRSSTTNCSSVPVDTQSKCSVSVEGHKRPRR